MDTDGDNTAAAVVSLVQSKTRIRIERADVAVALLRIRRPWLLLIFQASSFLRCWSNGRGVPSDQATMAPIGACSNMACADMLSSIC